jgi:hypothetical protein
MTASHRLNVYYDVQDDVDKTLASIYGTPGLTDFSYITGQPSLGLHWVEAKDFYFVVQEKTLYQLYKNGTFVSRGTLVATPASYVSMADNGTQLAIFDGLYAYIYNMDTNVFTDITASLPWVTTPGTDFAGNSVTFLDGMFIALRPGTGQFYISNLYNGLIWNPLDFATAESNPDQLVSIAADKGNLTLLGYTSIEIWSNIGDTDFPFQRINASPNEGGLAARWSLAKCKGDITGLFRNKNGALSICMLVGYLLQPISTKDLDYIISNYQSPTDAVGFGYTMNGRAFYQITFRTEGKTWLYDFLSGAWSQLQSYGHDRHIGDLCASYDNLLIVSGYNDGRIYLLDADNYTDNGERIIREITGTHSFRPSYNNITIRRLRIDIEGGVGTLALNPKMMLQISRDYGHTWGRELWVDMGKEGEYKHRAEWRRLGMSRDWVFKIRMSDPVKLVINNAVVEGEELSK